MHGRCYKLSPKNEGYGMHVEKLLWVTFDLFVFNFVEEYQLYIVL